MKMDLYHAHIQKIFLRKQKLDLIRSSLKSIKGHYQESEKTKSSTNGAGVTGHPHAKKKKMNLDKGLNLTQNGSQT